MRGRTYLARTQPFRDAAGAIAGAVGVAVDVRGRTVSEEALRASEQRYRELFEESPISLWEEDFSAAKAHIDELRAAGVSDLSAYFAEHPEAVLRCAQLVKVVQVNQATVELAEGASKQDFLENLGDTFTSETYELFAQELVALAAGRTRFAGETVGRTLRGREVDYAILLSVAPGAEQTWSKVLISVSEITERKRASSRSVRGHLTRLATHSAAPPS